MKKSIWIFATIGLTSILITSCLTNKSDKIAVKIEFPTIHYTIAPLSDTTLFGPQGTRIFIGSGTFQVADGSPALDSIKIELKEFYKKSDIILGNLSTVSGDRLLETGGMIYIDASSKGQKLEIKPNKRIVVHFPKEDNDYRDMNLFFADSSANETSVTNWIIDTVNFVKRTLKLGSFGWWYPDSDDSTDYDFTPKNYVDTGYYWNPIDYYVSAYNFSEKTKNEIESTWNKNDYPKFESWNDYGVECEMSISEEGFIEDPKVITKVTKKTKQEILQFLKDLPQLEPGKDKYGDIIERRGLLFIQGGDIVPLYKTDEEYIKSFDSKYLKFEKKPIKNLDFAELNYYIFSISKLGWINCDYFINIKETTDLFIPIPPYSETTFKLVFRDIDGVLIAKIIGDKYVFTKVPKGRQVTIIGFKNENGKFMTAFKEITITDKPIKDLIFNETTLVDLREKLEKL